MQNFNIKNFFQDKKVVEVFVATLVSVIIVLLIGAGVVWHYRGSLFSYFANQYMKESQQVTFDPKTGEQINTGAPSPVLGQDSMVIDAVKKTNPAVVSIIISKEVPTYKTVTPDPNTQQYNPFGDMFPQFNQFYNAPQYVQNGTEKKDIGGGSGFLVSSDGLIVTNKHVVEEKGVEYTVFTNDGEKHTATVVALDPVLDIALVRIQGTNFPYLNLGNSDTLQVGQSVIAIGNALAEFRNTVSVGVISGLARSITAGDHSGNSELLDQVLQTDAAINPGNSGGPLLNLYGQVIGVNVAVAEGSQNIGFALPINSVKGAIDSVKATGKIVRPYLGLRYVPVTAELKAANNLSVDYGVLVKGGATASELAVIPGSPADKAGIVENDIILEVDGIKLDDKINLASIIRQKKIGDVIALKVLHRGNQIGVSVTLEAAPSTTP